MPDATPIRSGKIKVRSPVAAGQFYPGNRERLFAAVGKLMSASPPVGLRSARAVLVPHAGYIFSGEIAARSFREIKPDFKTVFLLAANHNGYARFSGASIPEVTHYGIPGAKIPLSAIVDDLKEDPLFLSEPRAHTMHMLEAELPFLHFLRGQPEKVDFSIVPIILGDLRAKQIDRLVDRLAPYSNPHTLFVFSVDLSHFHTDEKARKLDSYTIEKIMGRDRDGLSRAVTDGDQVLMTMVELARRMEWEPTFLGYRNSGEVNGDQTRVVGYASIVFSETFYLTAEERKALLDYARKIIEDSFSPGPGSETDSDLTAKYPVFRVPRGVFVTLKKDNDLRGCIGHLVSNKPIAEGVRACALDAAFRDPRFPPLKENELKDLTLSISILNYPGPVRVDSPEEYPSVLKPGRDGVILLRKGRQSTFLPQVWLDLPEPRDFLSQLSRKQGAPADSWRDPDTVILSYNAYEFSE